ncbi:MAG: hypothetical protein ACOCVG_00385, partial [Verrucomicrobiota bacterium]
TFAFAAPKAEKTGSSCSMSKSPAAALIAKADKTSSGSCCASTDTVEVAKAEKAATCPVSGKTAEVAKAEKTSDCGAACATSKGAVQVAAASACSTSKDATQVAKAKEAKTCAGCGKEVAVMAAAQ